MYVIKTAPIVTYSSVCVRFYEHKY